MVISDIYIFVCMYVYMYICRYIVLSMVRSRTRLRITLTARRTGHFTWAGVALTNTVDSSIAHTPWKKRKQIKEKAGMGEGNKTE